MCYFCRQNAKRQKELYLRNRLDCFVNSYFLIVMNKLFVIFTLVLFAFSSCKTREKVLYFQDATTEVGVPTQQIVPLQFRTGDKLSVIVTSSATPELALQFNLPIVTVQAGAASSSSSNQIALYTVDENGYIDVPTLGRVKVSNYTRAEAASVIQSRLREKLLKDAVVTVNSYDQFVTVLGDVKNPGRVVINRDNITLLEVLGMVGDLNMTARRDRIMVIRQEGNESKTYYADIRSKNFLNSPVYNLQQNDVVYVEPNRVKMGQSTNNDNSVRSISTWLSVSSVLISLGILIFR